MTLSVWHIIGILFTLLLIAGVSAYSGKRVKNASDFATGGGKAGMWIVAGAIMGTLVSGQATIGTAQLAFTYGMSAWWFTLGSGIGCLILTIGYVIPLRESGSTTLLEVISKEYGAKAEYTGSVLCSIGIFISVISQMLSATALLTTIFSISIGASLCISIVLMAAYVIFGGVWGAGMGGVAKTVLLYLACVVGAVMVWSLAGGSSGLMQSLKDVLGGTALGATMDISSAGEVGARFANLLARGPLKDIGSGLSLLLGVLSTQTYAQAIWSGESHSAARKGALLSAFLIPPIGVACILIGLFMRAHYITTDEIALLTEAGKSIPAGLTEIASTSQAFPVFVVNHLPHLFGGIVLGTLFITVIGGGSGLSLGVATILVRDIFAKLSARLKKDPAKQLVVTRATIICVLIAAAGVAFVVPGAIINDFGFLSMGLRGAVVFVPLTCALFAKGKIAPQYALISIIAGPVAVLAGQLISLSFDPLYLGIAINIVVMAIGAAAGKGKLSS